MNKIRGENKQAPVKKMFKNLCLPYVIGMVIGFRICWYSNSLANDSICPPEQVTSVTLELIPISTPGPRLL